MTPEETKRIAWKGIGYLFLSQVFQFISILAKAGELTFIDMGAKILAAIFFLIFLVAIVALFFIPEKTLKKWSHAR